MDGNAEKKENVENSSGNLVTTDSDESEAGALPADSQW